MELLVKFGEGILSVDGTSESGVTGLFRPLLLMSSSLFICVYIVMVMEEEKRKR